MRQFSILDEIAHKKTFPAIITDKAKRRLADRNALLEKASAGFEFVDVDLHSDSMKDELKEIAANGAEVITSFHDSAATPSASELRRILRIAKKKGGDIYKIVTMAKTPKDNLTILNFLEESSRQARIVSFAMGPMGIPSRILSPIFGAEFTFAGLRGHSSTAPGQLTIDNLRSVWNVFGLQ